MRKEGTKEIRKQAEGRTHSMQFRFLATVILAMLSVSLLAGGIVIYELSRYVRAQSEAFVTTTCENEATQINADFKDMEKSVRIMESYVMGFFASEADVTDHALHAVITESTARMFADVAAHTEGGVSYYVRFAPEIAGSGVAGLFYSKLDGSKDYTAMTPTDLSLYPRDDVQHVGWYWQPYEAGEAVWMTPYYNENNSILMISYVVPLYYGERFVGVVGMDFDYAVLTDRVHEIKIYDHGFAHLELDGTVMHESEHTTDTEGYLRVSRGLENGMSLVLSASLADIREIRTDIGMKLLLAMLILSSVFIAAAILIVRRTVAPLKNLTAAAEKLSGGDYDVRIGQSNVQEIRLLSTAFGNMATHLREREEQLYLSARRDALTGLRNTTAYNEFIAEFDERAAGGAQDFGVIVLDIDNLKLANDAHGHEVGNELIATAAATISGTFRHSPVFRIGGDEFAVILEGEDLARCEELLMQFALTCKGTLVNETARIPLCIAVGFARLAPGDHGYQDVFKRADRAMYQNKRSHKKE